MKNTIFCIRAAENAARFQVWNEEVTNVAKSDFAVLALSLAFALLRVSAMGQISGDQQPGFKAPFVGSSLTCSQSSPTETLIVPKAIAKRAQLKARLLSLLRESLYDDSKGIVNMAREKEIASLANKLKKQG
jgi:hypothetical protein